MGERHELTQAIAIDDFLLIIERADHGAVIRLTDRAGREPLRIALGPGGPVLSLGGGLAIAVSGELSLEAERISIHGREGLELSSGGDTTVRCEGDLVSDAREQRHGARLGDVRLEANDDVKLLGERIRLNC